MTSFEAGFLSYLTECGLPEKYASHILDRAAAHPQVQETIKAARQLPAESRDSLDVLSSISQLHNIDSYISKISSQINL